MTTKKKWVDIKRLRPLLDFEEVLRSYGIELKVNGSQHHGYCPLPSHDGKKNSPSFSANLKRGIWQCFGCGQKGNIVDFAILMEKRNPKNGDDVRRVAQKLYEEFVRPFETLGDGPEDFAEDNHSEKEETNVVVNAPLDFELKGLERHPYLLDRGFSPETIAQFGLSYCSRGLLRNRIAIPLRNSTGSLVGYAGRVTDEDSITDENPKYKFPGKRKRKGVIYEFRKSLLLYNANRIGEANDLVVVEGFTSVWWLSQAGITNVVATMGASCSEEQGQLIKLLVNPDGRVWIFTDGDAAGERCAQDIFLYVAPHRFIRWIRLDCGFQPTDFDPVRLKECFPFAVR